MIPVSRCTTIGPAPRRVPNSFSSTLGMSPTRPTSSAIAASKRSASASARAPCRPFSSWTVAPSQSSHARSVGVDQRVHQREPDAVVHARPDEQLADARGRARRTRPARRRARRPRARPRGRRARARPRSRRRRACPSRAARRSSTWPLLAAIRPSSQTPSRVSSLHRLADRDGGARARSAGRPASRRAARSRPR